MESPFLDCRLLKVGMMGYYALIILPVDLTFEQAGVANKMCRSCPLYYLPDSGSIIETLEDERHNLSLPLLDAYCTGIVVLSMIRAYILSGKEFDAGIFNKYKTPCSGFVGEIEGQ